LRCVVDEIVGEQFLENIEIPFAWTSSVFRRTTALAASDDVMLLIWVTSLRSMDLSIERERRSR
jgi:hypothetical protein